MYAIFREPQTGVTTWVYSGALKGLSTERLRNTERSRQGSREESSNTSPSMRLGHSLPETHGRVFFSNGAVTDRLVETSRFARPTVLLFAPSFACLSAVRRSVVLITRYC